MSTARQDRVVAVAVAVTSVGGLLIAAASLTHVQPMVEVAGWSLFLLGSLLAVAASWRAGDGVWRGLGRGARTLVGWLIAFLP